MRHASPACCRPAFSDGRRPSVSMKHELCRASIIEWILHVERLRGGMLLRQAGEELLCQAVAMLQCGGEDGRAALGVARYRRQRSWPERHRPLRRASETNDGATLKARSQNLEACGRSCSIPLPPTLSCVRVSEHGTQYQSAPRNRPLPAAWVTLGGRMLSRG